MRIRIAASCQMPCSILAHAWNTSCFGLYRLFISVAGGRSIVCGAFSGFCSLPTHPLLSTVYQCDGCLFFSGTWGLMAGLSGLPAIGAVSILELAANSRSSRMFRAPNLQRATMLFILIMDSRGTLISYNASSI